MTSADVQLIGRIRLQKNVPRAGSFEVNLVLCIPIQL